MTTDREQLANQQEQLIDALLCGAPAPAEVDAQQVQICAQSLRNKRARVLNKLAGNPDTTCSVAEKSEMNDYFKTFPGVHPDGGFADLKRYKKFVKGNRRRAFFNSILKCLGLTSN